MASCGHRKETLFCAKISCKVWALRGGDIA
nr:MAG TPA_asm: hypothetical protein [Caudoviricetes sp.]